MSLLDDTKLEKFAAYAEKHGLYDLFQDLLSKMIVAMPSDPFQFMIDFLKKPSGVGQKIAKALDAVYVSSGEVLQAAIQKQTSAGVQCKSFVEKGQLVPDVLVTSLVVALEFDVSDEFVVQRASDLRFDPVTSKLYHLKDDPPPKNVFIQKRLIKKESDSPQFAQHRLVLYRHELGNVQTFFKQTHQRFFMKHGIVGNEHLVLPQVLDAVGSFPKSKAPQFFKLLVLGLPGSGREMVAEMIEQKYNRIRVSPRLVLNELQAANDPKASEILAYGDIESVPADIMGPLLAKRLQQPDCKERGWVLHGFPNTKEEAQILQQLGIEPSRYFD
ncbi:hypothetical protein EDD86DRAFT_245114 [Gorgonomyces haynaldii]|nr:hypothetical protein EDD86DRAFT_245114 [Gorgonomyces haynaldii]